jgi:type VI secretion system secreted protein Hcp
MMTQSHRFLSIVLTALPVLLASRFEARADEKTFVSIANLPGESTDSAHPNWIDAYALDAGITTPGSVASFSDVSVLKGTDRSTPGLNDALARGVILPLVVIEVCRTGAPQQCYYRVELTNARVSATQLSGSSCVGSGACTPAQTESVSFKYTKIKWIYTPWTGGTMGTQVIKCFDLAANQAC